MVTAERLVMERMGKVFPGVIALDAVDFSVRAGEIHALLGQNGAGKSTLMNILAGVLQPDSGQILLDGTQVTIRNPAHAQALGIRIVHQELSLFPSRSIAENILVGRLPRRRAGFLDQPALDARARDALDLLHLPLDPATLVRDLPFSQQQMVEIAKALSFGGKVLILDEPTSALTEHESALLFRQLDRLRRNGAAIIYVSHRLREVFEISDRLTILRDGRRVGAFPIAEASPDKVISMIVSRAVAEVARTAPPGSRKALLSVKNLTVLPRVRGVDLELNEGEILGIAGLAGAGQSEIGRAIGGLLSHKADAMTLADEPFRATSPRAAMRRGVVYLPADRRAEGLFLRLNVQQNIVASSFRRLSAGTFVRDSEARKIADGFVESLSIRTPSVRQVVGNLSGGNQQKVVLARGLTVEARVFVADEPTRGIDVGAKAEIYALLRRLAASGKGILLISTELPELLVMSDRIIVINSGRIAGELTRAEATEERVMAMASGDVPLAS
jgi:ribose transport system ATP-binding protein